MSAQEIIEQIKALPPNERAQVTKFVVETDDSWIPDEFRESMADIAAGRVVDLDTALNEPYPGDLQKLTAVTSGMPNVFRAEVPQQPLCGARRQGCRRSPFSRGAGTL